MLFPLWVAAQSVASPAPVRQAYVTDRLVVAIRATPGTQGAALALVTSGTPLEVLNRQNGYARVRTADGVAGWVEQVYLSNEPTAAVRLAKLEAGLPAVSVPPAGAPARRPSALRVGAGLLIALALLALGFGAGLAHQVRRERARLYGLRL